MEALFTANACKPALHPHHRHHPLQRTRSYGRTTALRTRVCVAQAGDSSPTSAQRQSLLSFLCPLLKLVGGTDPSAPRNDFFERTTSGISSLARFPWGSRVLSDIAELSKTREVAQPLQLYEFEACPFCRRVREALTELDLSSEVYPCPKGSLHHRNFVRERGGKEQFPYLIDMNTGISLYESGDIVKYLFKTYGGGKEPSKGLLESTILTGWVPTLMRAGRGMSRWQAAIPEIPRKKLELFSYENNQFARIVREALCELELPYVLHNVGVGSTGASQGLVPLLLDPNTGPKYELGRRSCNTVPVSGHSTWLECLSHDLSHGCSTSCVFCSKANQYVLLSSI
ncbi:hypothetical protein GOP47_0022468 [Adiantum capillus-veneris]|uniref:GST N-terminal domain-containing protein n=1 Tax=Adiantum capillus-veneris TaxID=13818 RepID=A0A9D4Z5D2_ADICA|nr:hypothetical protein GOP47_0022468 [Adiantum capillus-veneris]